MTIEAGGVGERSSVPNARQAKYDRLVEGLASNPRTADIAEVFRAYEPDDDMTKNPLTEISRQLLAEPPQERRRHISESPKRRRR